MTTMLNVKDLRAYYGQVQALHGLSFSLNEGSLTTLLGANGAGKTTTLRAICNMVRSTGAIEFEGKPIGTRSTENVVRLGIAHVPQGRGILLRGDDGGTVLDDPGLHGRDLGDRADGQPEQFHPHPSPMMEGGGRPAAPGRQFSAAQVSWTRSATSCAEAPPTKSTMAVQKAPAPTAPSPR